jgi:hypothetical protein
LEENNKSLETERDELVRLNKGIKDQMAVLRDEKTSWQNKCLAVLEGDKMPRSEDTYLSEEKRRSGISESISITTSNLEDSSSTNSNSESASQPLSISSDNSQSSSSVTDVEQSSKSAAFQINRKPPPKISTFIVVF